jgi:hypothetical protein
MDFGHHAIASVSVQGHHENGSEAEKDDRETAARTSPRIKGLILLSLVRAQMGAE